MDEKKHLQITNRDRVLRAWQNSTELVRDYQGYTHEITSDKRLTEMFARFAKDEALHAASLLEVLQEM